MWEGANITIYYNGKAETAKCITKNVNVRDHCEFGVLGEVTISFNGFPPFDSLNFGDYNSYSGCYSWKTANALRELLNEHNYYFQFENNWNFNFGYMHWR